MYKNTQLKINYKLKGDGILVNNILNETTIGTAKVIVDILPVGKVIPSAKINPTSITIHQTGNMGQADNLQYNANPY